jgi:hypothetical protein
VVASLGYFHVPVFRHLTVYFAPALEDPCWSFVPPVARDSCPWHVCTLFKLRDPETGEINGPLRVFKNATIKGGRLLIPWPFKGAGRNFTLHAVRHKLGSDLLLSRVPKAAINCGLERIVHPKTLNRAIVFAGGNLRSVRETGQDVVQRRTFHRARRAEATIITSSPAVCAWTAEFFVDSLAIPLCDVAL